MALTINRETAVYKGIRTGIQAILAFLVGAVLVVWNVPGVPEALYDYVVNDTFQNLASVGVLSGLAGFLWNAARKDVPTA